MITQTDSSETGLATVSVPPGSGLDLEDRLRRISALTEHSVTAGTRRVYSKMAAQYDTWIAEHGLFRDWRSLLLYLDELHSKDRK